jgi:hypothetical protein
MGSFFISVLGRFPFPYPISPYAKVLQMLRAHPQKLSRVTTYESQRLHVGFGGRFAFNF